MRNKKLDQYLRDVAEGRMSPAEAAERLRMSAYDDIDFAKIDTNRELRTGNAEVVFALGKTPEQVAVILRRMAENEYGDRDEAAILRSASKNGSGDGDEATYLRSVTASKCDKGEDQTPPLLATKATPEHFAAVREAFADGFMCSHGLTLDYNETAKMIIIKPAVGLDQPKSGLIAVVSGGTADMPIAEEAAVTSELYGHEVMRIYDVGISGLHRLLDRTGDIRKADVVIAVAGMEGALASVLSGLVRRPVIGVPTSIGYGITLSGLTPLFAMLGSCSLGIGVMNIDNGFGAAHYASKILGVRDGGS